MIGNTDPLLEHICRLAAIDTAASAASITVFRQRGGQAIRSVAHGLSREGTAAVAVIDKILAGGTAWTVVPDILVDQRFAPAALVLRQSCHRFLVHINLFSSASERIGYICLLDETPRQGLTEAQTAALTQIAAMVVADRKREQRHLHLMFVADRARRTDGLMRTVADAASCVDALSHVLAELCVINNAVLGQVWMMTQPNTPLQEVCRYQRPTPSPNTTGQPDDSGQFMDVTVDAIRRNRPLAVNPSALKDTPRSHSNPAIPVCYVCVPIWVQQQRFGIALTFNTENRDLDLVVADITALAVAIRPTLFRKVNEDRVRFAAHHDDLTQLPNRALFQERLRRALAVARVGGHGFALLYLDLDGFKHINDTRGHETGDRLLVAVADRLRRRLREGDTVARIGGDEFAILQTIENDPATVSGLAERLLETVADPFEIAGATSVVGISIGIAFYPQDGETPDVLMRHADIALYRAKQAGRNTYRLYSPEPHTPLLHCPPMERELHDAVERNQMSLAFQPICDATSLRIAGFEALTRWDHPTQGPIEPDRFIPLAEANGLIVPLGRWALEAACTEAARWVPPVTVSVNLSPAQFRQIDLPEHIADILTRTGLPAARLELEVTEGVLLEDVELMLRTMRSIQEQGVRIMLDDFGTGYAGLGYLRRFPFQGVKIDQSFVRDLSRGHTARSIIESVLMLCDRLHLGVVAEGVENEHQLITLRDLGCRLVQGYYVGRPCTPQNAHALLLRSVAQETTLA